MQKGEKYDWKQEDDTYTLIINNPLLEDDGERDSILRRRPNHLLNLNVAGSYILLVKEVDAKTSGDLACRQAFEHSISEADIEMKIEYISN